MGSSQQASGVQVREIGNPQILSNNNSSNKANNDPVVWFQILNYIFSEIYLMYPTICCLQETHLIERDTHRLKVKGWEKTYHAHRHSKKARVSILISDNVDFKPKLVRRDKEGHFILLKGCINQQDITIINIYAPNIGSSTYVKQILLNSRSQIEHTTIILGNFNTPLSTLDRSSKQKLNKETIDLNNTINNLDLTDI